MTDCEKWLAEKLAGQIFINCEEIKQDAAGRGFSRGQLSAARKRLGVTTISDAALHDGEAENWFWLIPREVGGID